MISVNMGKENIVDPLRLDSSLRQPIQVRLMAMVENRHAGSRLVGAHVCVDQDRRAIVLHQPTVNAKKRMTFLVIGAGNEPFWIAGRQVRIEVWKKLSGGEAI